MSVLEGFKKKRVVFMNDTIKTFHTTHVYQLKGEGEILRFQKHDSHGSFYFLSILRKLSLNCIDLSLT